MTLDRTTYEAWLLDRIEGRLTPEQERALHDFLAANPDLPVFDGELPAIATDAASFVAKEMLHKHFPPTGAPDVARLTDFLIARLEGTLSPEQEQQLDQYLYEHPEAARTAREVAATRVSADPIRFTEKAGVQRHFPPKGLPDHHHLTDFLIAAREGDLDAAQRVALERYVAIHPEAVREQQLIAAARIVVEPVVFAEKQQLKKREVRVVPLWSRLAVAASVLLLLGLGWWLLRGQEDEAPRIARHEQPSVKPVREPSRQPVRKEQENSPTSVVNEERSPDAVEQPSSVHSNKATAPVKGASVEQGPIVPPHGSVKPEQEQPVRPVPAPTQEPGPTLAQTPVAPVTIPEKAPALAQVAPANEHAEGVPLGTFVANTVRGEVLDTPQRSAALDGNDAVAMVDKGLSALTGGHGGVAVQRTGARERLQLRLGRNFGITASRGR